MTAIRMKLVARNCHRLLPALSASVFLLLGAAARADETPGDPAAPKPEPKPPVKVRTRVAPKPVKTVPAARKPLQEEVPQPTVQLKEGEAPKIEFDTLVYNFGKVESGESILHDYWFTNTGTGTLEVLKVKTSCGCTKAGPHDQIVQPGASGKIPIRLTPKGHSGHASKSVTVWTNCPTEGKVLLRIEGETWEPVAINPNPLLVAEVGAEPVKQQVTFTNNTPDNVGVAEVSVVDTKVSAKFEEVTPGKQYNITLEFPKGYEMPAAGTELVIKTNNPKVPEKRIPVRLRPNTGKPGARLVGKPAPVFKATTVSGKSVEVGGAAGGEVTVLEFYTSWCGFCKRSLPEVEKISKTYEGKKVRVLGVSEDSRPGPDAAGKRGRTEEQILEHAKQLGLTFDLIMDPSQDIGSKYLVKSFPSMYIVGPSGKIESAHFGAERDLVTSVTRNIDRLLGTPSAAPAADAKAAAEPAAAAAPAVASKSEK